MHCLMHLLFVISGISNVLCCDCRFFSVWEVLSRQWAEIGTGWIGRRFEGIGRRFEGIGRGIQGGINAAEQYSQLSVGHLSSTREWQQHFGQSERWLIGSTCMYSSVDERIWDYLSEQEPLCAWKYLWENRKYLNVPWFSLGYRRLPKGIYKSK